MILTQGEKMVWAAAHAVDREGCCGEHTPRGEEP